MLLITHLRQQAAGPAAEHGQQVQHAVGHAGAAALGAAFVRTAENKQQAAGQQIGRGQRQGNKGHGSKEEQDKRAAEQAFAETAAQNRAGRRAFAVGPAQLVALRNHTGGHPFAAPPPQHKAHLLVVGRAFVAEHECRLREKHPRFDGLNLDIARFFLFIPAHYLAHIGFAVHQFILPLGLLALFMQRLFFFRAAPLQAGRGGIFRTVEQPIAADGVALQHAA